MEEDVGFGDLISQFISYELQGMQTAIPAIVLDVKENGSSLLIDVQPLINILTREDTSITEAPIFNVPMQQPASSVGGMVFPVSKGDNVWLIFSQRGIDMWKYGTGTPVTPIDYRRFDRKDCIAIPCVFPKSLSMAAAGRHGSDYSVGDTILFNKKGGTEIVVKSNGDVVVNAPNRVTVNCAQAEVNASDSMTVNTNEYNVNCTSYTVSSSSYTVGTTNYSMNATGTAVSTGTYSMNGSFVLNSIPMESHGHIEQGDGNRVSNPVA